ncbi:MAG: glycosyltransferase family 2 protein [Chloroflexi bacterium]|nr:glycosyltransferase family 2 protein [Chloroflexota bacterium]
MDLSVVIVNWNVRDLLRACLASLYAAPGAVLLADGTLQLGAYRVEVLVVDNASSDGSVAMLRAEFPRVTAVDSGANLGYTGGNNLALGRCRGRYALLLNPDTRVLDAALTTLLDYAEAHPDVGVVGPRLVYGDGSPAPARYRFPTLATALMESTRLEELFPRNRWTRRYHMADTPDDATQDVGWVTGACVLVRRAAWERVGLLDEAFFMYSEEVDWCRRMANDGWRVVYLPTAVVVHYEGRSSAQVSAARHIRFQTSKIHYFRKHHGRLQAGVLRGCLWLDYLMRLVEECAKYLVGHKRALRRERLAIYWQVLRSGLRSPEKGARP